ncbi:nuclear transport factor 2 family protein [Hyphococcus formosus]|uniref:YybH family protein n=1 Tax=Hyphococcus formosus TaxID=3143534 RepID=UPI00398B7253
MKTFILCASMLALAACSNSGDTDSDKAATTEQTENLQETLLPDYLARINANDLDTVMAGFTDDVVFQAPNAPEVIGKAALREWIGGYLAAFDTQWVKTSQDMIVSGDYAIERYSYQSTDTMKATGSVHTDIGKGIIIYHKEADGVWRVAHDVWSSDLPLTPPGE